MLIAVLVVADCRIVYSPKKNILSKNKGFEKVVVPLDNGIEFENNEQYSTNLCRLKLFQLN